MLRPCMPDMLPVIGPVPNRRGLWCTFGHGHHGFTLGPISAQFLARMMDGEGRAQVHRALSPGRYL